VDAVRTLLRAGVAVNTRNAAGKMPLQLASESGALQQVEQCFMAELLQNVCSGQTARIERLLSSGLDASKTDGSADEATLLHWAAAFGQGRDVVNLLVHAGANPNALNKAGATPAHEASANGALETLEALREAGADFALKTPRGKTPKDVARSAEIASFFGEAAALPSVKPIPSTPLPASSPVPASPAPPRKQPSTTALETLASSNGGFKSQNNNHSSSNLAAAGIARTATPPPEQVDTLKRKLEERDALIDSLRSTVDGLLRDHGVHEYVQRLQEHVGALTRQLAATAEQRDKLQNLYVANDRELERLARELALARSMSPKSSTAALKRVVSAEFKAPNGTEGAAAQEELEDLRDQVAQLTEELERERKDGYAAARMHLTYEADLRAEIKALQEQMLANEVGNAAFLHDEQSKGFFASLLPW
jgi:hypothetical protein